jgi:serine protease Do
MSRLVSLSVLGTSVALAWPALATAQRAPTPPAPPATPAPSAAPAPPVVMHGASGWVGVSLVQSGRGDDASGVAMGYPVIAGVEPGSPAQAAGLQAGDTVLAYNDVNAHDDPLGVQRFLHPGERLVMKIRRDGVRDVALIVARRPSHSRMRVSVNTSEMTGMPMPSMVQVGPIPIAAPLRMLRDAPLAGASLARLNPGLASVLNVRDEGVLVVDVLPNSPAMASGLEPGDVIVRADTIAVLSPMEVMRAMRVASDHAVLLELVRKGKTQKVSLHW